MNNTMIRAGLCALATFSLTLATSAETEEKIHVPNRLGDIRPIFPAAKKTNHLTVVNVGGAIPEEDWAKAVLFAASRININLWTNSIPRSVIGDLVGSRGTLARTLDEKTKVAVFIEDGDAPQPYVAAPGAWCRVDIRYLKQDNPSKQTLLDRYAKAILRGILFAAGCGSGYDQLSVSGYNSMTLKGLDEAGITITPEAYFPMLEVLRAVGGDDIVAPCVD